MGLPADCDASSASLARICSFPARSLSRHWTAAFAQLRPSNLIAIDLPLPDRPRSALFIIEKLVENLV